MKLRFRIKTLMIACFVIAICCTVVGYVLRKYRAEQSAIVCIQRDGGSVRGTAWPWPFQRIHVVATTDRAFKAAVRLSGVVGLSVVGVRDVDLNSVAKIKSLRILELVGCTTDDLSPLAQLRELWWVKIANTDRVDLQDLVNAKFLGNLSLLNIGTINGPEDVLNVAYLGVRDVRDVSFLKSIRGATHMSLNVRNIDLRLLTNCRELEWLSVTSPAVDDVSPFADLPRLQSLSLEGCTLNDITPLTRCRSLTFIQLDNVKCPDLSPLARCPKLRQVNLYGTPCDPAARRLLKRTIGNFNDVPGGIQRGLPSAEKREVR